MGGISRVLNVAAIKIDEMERNKMKIYRQNWIKKDFQLKRSLHEMCSRVKIIQKPRKTSGKMLDKPQKCVFDEDKFSKNSFLSENTDV